MQGDINAKKKDFCMGKVMCLSVKLGICLQTQFFFFPFYIPGILHFVSGNHGASLAGHLGPQDLSPLAYGKVSHHHAPAGSTGAWLSEGWPPECLEMGGVGVRVFRSDWERQARRGPTGRRGMYCTLKRDGEGLVSSV